MNKREPTKPKIIVQPGEVVSVEYIVENLSEQTQIYKQQGAEVWRKLREMAKNR